MSIPKFNKLKTAKDTAKYLDYGIKGYVVSKAKKDSHGMKVTENLVLACGGTVEQAAFPSEFLFKYGEWIAPGFKVRWQKRRDKAQKELETLLN